jgi:hypothetical protein
MNTTNKSYTSVLEMIKDVFDDDPQFIEEFKQRQDATKIARGLSIARNLANLSYVDIANKLNCSPLYIEGMEESLDKNLDGRDIELYINAIKELTKKNNQEN